MKKITDFAVQNQITVVKIALTDTGITTSSIPVLVIEDLFYLSEDSEPIDTTGIEARERKFGNRSYFEICSPYCEEAVFVVGLNEMEARTMYVTKFVVDGDKIIGL